jgi:uncharacterized membrane protein
MRLARTAAPPLTASGKERIFQEAAMSHTSEHIPAGIARRSRSSHSYDRFGRFAEWLVRAFGMPWFLAAQTAVIVAWVATNSLAGLPHFDPYPFVFMNLVLSALAAYAAPFILLAETRQADRDRARARAEERHHDELERRQQELLGQDNSQTQQIARLFEQDTAQTDHRGQMLAQVTVLLERESDQTDVIVALAAKTVEMAEAKQALTREIHSHTVSHESRGGRQPTRAADSAPDAGCSPVSTQEGAGAPNGKRCVHAAGGG